MKRITTVSMLVVLVASAVAAQTSPVWEPEMQINVKAVGSPRVSPDGKKVVYAVSEAVMTSDKSEFVTQLWMGDIATKKNVQLTFG